MINDDYRANGWTIVPNDGKTGGDAINGIGSANTSCHIQKIRQVNNDSFNNSGFADVVYQGNGQYSVHWRLRGNVS